MITTIMIYFYIMWTVNTTICEDDVGDGKQTTHHDRPHDQARRGEPASYVCDRPLVRRGRMRARPTRECIERRPKREVLRDLLPQTALSRRCHEGLVWLRVRVLRSDGRERNPKPLHNQCEIPFGARAVPGLRLGHKPRGTFPSMDGTVVT